MNERIKELEIQAADGTIDPNEPFTAEEFYNFTKKFAELIVQECADKCLEMAYANPGPHHYAAMLKEHFGVEE
jgi:hypothetical protein